MENLEERRLAAIVFADDMTRSEWEKYRANRILPKKLISILNLKIKLKFKKEKIIATFNQNYKDNNLYLSEVKL